MKSNFVKWFWKTRRKLLRWIVPEWIWPEYVEMDGVPIGVKNRPYSFATKRILVRGGYESSERELLKGRILPGDVIIEMGGSIGILTAILSHMTGKTGRVVSIEASAKIADYSRSWLKEKGNVDVITGYGFPVYALEKPIFIQGLDESAGSLGGIVTYSTGQGKSVDLGENIYDIRKIMSQFNIRPDVLVIDVEGSEKTMIENELGFPDSVRLVLIELHPHIYGQNTMEKVVSALMDSRFSLLERQAHVFLFEKIQRDKVIRHHP